MDPYTSFFLGILVVLVPLFIFYVLSLNFTGVNDAWQLLFCEQV